MEKQMVSLPYGKGKVDVVFPPGWEMEMVAAKTGAALADTDTAVRQALRQPDGRPPLRDWVQPGEKVAVITSDATRPALQYLYLLHILAELAAAGIQREDVLLVIGLGTHRPPTAVELHNLLGRAADQYPVAWPDCDDEANLVHLGTTSRGTPVRIFRPVAEADRVILTGSIHHHVLAGFSAGPKSLLPGVAARDSIETNHALALHPEGGLHPGCAAGRLEGNPMQADFVEALRLFPKPTFLLNIVPAPEGGVLDVVAGDVIRAHRIGCETAGDHYAIPVNGRRPLVFASCGGYPSDAVLYQSTKGLMNLSLALADGGVGVLLAACNEGLGADSFLSWLRLGAPEAIEARLRRQFTVPGCIAYIVAAQVRRATMILVSQLDPAQVRPFGLTAADSVATAVALARQHLGEKVSGCLLPKAAITVPMPV